MLSQSEERLRLLKALSYYENCDLDPAQVKRSAAYIQRMLNLLQPGPPASKWVDPKLCDVQEFVGFAPSKHADFPNLAGMATFKLRGIGEVSLSVYNANPLHLSLRKTSYTMAEIGVSELTLAWMETKVATQLAKS